jgi:hypothetical protein
MTWSLTGTYVESCSCNTPCPCTVSLDLGADLDYCRALLAFNIVSGDVDGVDVAGVGAAMIADTPKVMSEGNWKVGLYLSDNASDEQAEALGRVFSGELGGPPAALGPLMGEFLGVERAPMQFRDDGGTHSIKIGDAVDIEVEDVVPFGAENGEPAKLTGIFHPAGETLTIARPTRAAVHGFGIEYEGKSGFSSSSFNWAG